MRFMFSLAAHDFFGERSLYGKRSSATRTICALFASTSIGAALPSGSAWQTFGLEVLLKDVLMFVIISVATDTRAVGSQAALAIGFTVALDALWGGPISGASMNPGRSFGPALVAGVWFK